jgi:uncharacterized protein (TIGR02284 family)
MALSIDQIISQHNDLIETCRDGEQGYQMAADSLDDRELKTLLQSYARQRGEFARDLQTEVRRLGGDPERHGSVAGTLHRGWINIKAAVTSRKPGDIMTECERGEDVAVKTYREALRGDLPEDVRSLVEQQYEHVEDAHDHIAVLRRAYQQGYDKPSFNY